ncbi:thiamine phosphate synthase [Carboxydothermus hydrogenoformans]|uniref:thiamine phosphate synthase n=1 Tax=Carboxydothermus hydrogenoformans TaxID=129958 RepID=UPI00030858F9|nr:thiamine phosphate synthase [Carboxydothermus hydrogenoformans]
MSKLEKLRLLEDYNIYCITAEKFSRGRENLKVVSEMLKAGIRIIQYREKYKSLKEKYYECLKIRELTRQYGAILIVNDHVDLCQMVDADGVHLGQDDYPVKEARRILGDEYIIGVSTHSPEQLKKAAKEGADYAGVGPLFATNTKDNAIPPVGLEYLKWAVANSSIPFVAIGGIKEYNIQEVLDLGSKCIALVTEIVGAEDIKDKIDRLNKILERYRVSNKAFD